jgi:hypothetical protein
MKYLFLPLVACLLLSACNPKTPESNPRVERPASSSRDESPAEETPVLSADEAANSDASAANTATQPAPKGVPFVGKRIFETRPAVTGTGTPHRFVEILANGDVFFQYGQQNAGTGMTMSGERYYAGKYRRVLKCVFEKLGDTRYYIIGKTAIVEVDEQGHRLNSEDCCPNEKVDMVTECPCEGNLFDPGA